MNLPATYSTLAGFTVQGASAEMLAELLRAYDFELSKRSFPVTDAFMPGLSRSEIQDALEAEGLTPPEELLVWWSWHNGVRLDVSTGWRRPQMSLGRALGMRAEDDLGLEPHQWDPAYIRVAGEGTKSSIAVSCSPVSPPPLVRAAAPEFGGTQGATNGRQVISLCTPVTWWLLALAKGWSIYDPSDGWEVDDEQVPWEWLLTGMTQ